MQRGFPSLPDLLLPLIGFDGFLRLLSVSNAQEGWDRFVPHWECRFVELIGVDAGEEEVSGVLGEAPPTTAWYDGNGKMSVGRTYVGAVKVKFEERRLGWRSTKYGNSAGSCPKSNERVGWGNGVSEEA